MVHKGGGPGWSMAERAVSPPVAALDPIWMPKKLGGIFYRGKGGIPMHQGRLWKALDTRIDVPITRRHCRALCRTSVQAFPHNSSTKLPEGAAPMPGFGCPLYGCNGWTRDDGLLPIWGAKGRTGTVKSKFSTREHVFQKPRGRTLQPLGQSGDPCGHRGQDETLPTRSCTTCWLR